MAGIGGNGRWPKLPDAVRDDVAHSTPGFSGRHQEMWWTLCDNAAEFLGPMGYEQASTYELLDAFNCNSAPNIWSPSTTIMSPPAMPSAAGIAARSAVTPTAIELVRAADPHAARAGPAASP